MTKPNIIIYIDAEEPSTHSMTPDQWKLFKKLYKECGDDSWSDELRDLADSTVITPQYIVSAFENDIVKCKLTA